MTKEQLDELIADLGYALMFLKQARQESRGADFQIGRARELTAKVGDALIKERRNINVNHPNHDTPKKGQLKGRAWTDKRREYCTLQFFNTDIRRDAGLSMDKVNALYDYVVNDNENWDGEHVEFDQIVKLMVTHYTRFSVRSSIP